MVKKPWNYGSLRIRLLNFIADEDIKQFFELSFVEKDKNFEVDWRKMDTNEQYIA